jgi:predicted transcriptional regulator
MVYQESKDKKEIFFINQPDCIHHMIQTDPIDRLMRAALSSDEEFVATLDDLLRRDLRISIREVSEVSGIAQSSLYKILHGKRSPNLSTLRSIIRAMRKFYRAGEGEFIGLIVARSVLETIEESTIEVDARRIKVREYPVHTMEDAIIAAVRAEREGAVAVVCAPIVSSVIEQLVHIPVATIIPRESVQRAIELAAHKAWL